MQDPYRLDRFVQAQDPVFATALQELRSGRKRSHWMWFIFPQIRGLGASAMADFYAISSLDEASAFVEHPVLGDGLRRCTRAVLAHAGTPLATIFGSPDDLKFRSSMTLFALAAPEEILFREAIDKLCGGRTDPKTSDLLAR